jgi:hypothetical protein
MRDSIGEGVMRTLFELLKALDDPEVSYRLERVRDSVMVVVVVPGERWEVEFFENGDIEVERFMSDGTIEGGEAVDRLLPRISE